MRISFGRPSCAVRALTREVRRSKGITSCCCNILPKKISVEVKLVRARPCLQPDLDENWMFLPHRNPTTLQGDLSGTPPHDNRHTDLVRIDKTRLKSISADFTAALRTDY